MSTTQSPRVETKDTKLIPQPHGGALLAGGNPGNKGGGRPRSVIREKLSGVMDEHGVAVLEQIITAPRETTFTCDECGHQQTVKPPSSDADRLRGVDIAGKYSIGTITQVDAEQVRARLGQTLDLIDEILNQEDAARLSAALRKVWQ